MMERIELLAPAQSLEILKAAVNAGADAVYVGTNAFNARMNAENLSIDDIIEGCNYAHLRGSKVYLTLNTLVNSYEINEAVNIASDCYNAGIDGVLVQDIGLLNSLRNKCPDIPVHASTQMNVNDINYLDSLKDLGISRVVLPREFSMDEIKEFTAVSKSKGIETEVFAHGAVCVCYSGLCLFSSMDKSGTRSGNRGQCAQPCRQEYKLQDKTFSKSGHLISPKDRSLVPFIKDIISSGVSSLKIEGRMRDVLYVTTVVSAYRKLIDAYYDGSLTNQTEKAVKNMLLVNFNRGGNFTSQYMTGTKNPGFLSGEFVGKYGLKLGNVTRTDKKSGGIEFSYDSKLPMPSKGDYLSIREENKELFSFPIGKLHEAPNRLTVKGLHPDSIATIKGNPDVYLMSHTFYDPKTDGVRKTEIKIDFECIDNSILKADATVLSGMNKDINVSYELDYDDNPEGNSISSDRLIQQLKKAGDTPFVVKEVNLLNSELPRCSVSLINELRRCVLEDLVSEIIYSNEHAVFPKFEFKEEDEEEEITEGNITTLYYFPTIKNVIKNMRRDADIYAFSLYDMSYKLYKQEILEFILSGDRKMALVLPDASHTRTKNYAIKQLTDLKEKLGEKFVAVIDSGVLLDEDFYKDLEIKHFISYGANIFNSTSFKYAASKCDAVSMSLELTADEITGTLSEISVKDRKNSDVIIHSGGPIPWMQSDFCPIGAHKNNCTECFEHNCLTMSKLENNEKDTIVVSHSFDCSSAIYGPSKFTMDNNVSEDIASMGYNVIEMYTEI